MWNSFLTGIKNFFIHHFKINDFVSKVSDLEKEFGTLQKDISKLMVRINAVERDIVIIRDRSFDIAHKFPSVERDIGNITNDLSGLMGDLIQLRVDIKGFDDIFKVITNKFESIQSDIESCKKQKPLPPIKREDLIYHKGLLCLKDNKTLICPCCYTDGKLVLIKKIDDGMWWEFSENIFCPECKMKFEN